MVRFRTIRVWLAKLSVSSETRSGSLHEPKFWYSLISGETHEGCKGATRIAREIENAMLADGWHCGKTFASQEELCARFGVGRYVMHEAIRILEIRGACRLKRGPGGGLVASSPDLERVSLATTVCMLKNEITGTALAEARAALDGESLSLAAARCADDGARGKLAAVLDAAPHHAQGLRESLVRHYESRLSVARFLGNPGFCLFVKCLNDLIVGVLMRTELAAAEETLKRHVDDYDSSLRECLKSGRQAESARESACASARQIDRTILKSAGAHRTLGRIVSIAGLVRGSGDGPCAIRVARLIAEDISAGKWLRGGRIGSEWELCGTYGVGQMTLRQAVRILEEYENVVTKPGRNNGIFCRSSSSFLPSIRMSHDYFAAQHLNGAAWWKVLRPLETALVAIASQRATPEKRLFLGRELPVLDEISKPAAINDYQRKLMYSVNLMAESPILELFWRTLCSYRHRAFARVADPARPTYEMLSEGCRELLETLTHPERDAEDQAYEMMSAPLQTGFRDWVSSPFE